jgi:hypothetical protein
VEDLWRLYALSRVNDILLLRFQPGCADGTAWPGPPVTLQQYLQFANDLGLSVAQEDSFFPFYHEVVEVDQAAAEDHLISITSSSWPCLMLGNMLFSRGGVRVHAGRNHVCKEVAESSTLYWASWRKNRPSDDLSAGWGSNSQWRTRFRRDYRVGGVLYFNVEGSNDLSDYRCGSDRHGLTRAERIELLTNRCFVTTSKPHDDLFPYKDTYTQPYAVVGNRRAV